MNVIVGTEPAGFVENAWVGHELRLGRGIRLNVVTFDARCVMTTLPQGDLPHDIDILRTLVKHNRLQVGKAGLSPCAGVYAVVTAPGTVRTGDPVSVGS
jgi:hypothetical protein